MSLSCSDDRYLFLSNPVTEISKKMGEVKKHFPMFQKTNPMNTAVLFEKFTYKLLFLRWSTKKRNFFVSTEIFFVTHISLKHKLC